MSEGIPLVLCLGMYVWFLPVIFFFVGYNCDGNDDWRGNEIGVQLFWF